MLGRRFDQCHFSFGSDSSREPQKENSDTPQNADEGGVNKLKTGNCSDEEADNSGEVCH